MNKEEVILRLGRDRFLAHQVLFKHRHSAETPEFHKEIVALWHSRQITKALVMAFREAGKSSISEEAFVIGAVYQLFKNAIIVGSTEKRACERLRAIKHELEQNEMIAELFGYQQGKVWNEAEIILANGVRIIAVGRGQSLRGTKHLFYRPDFCFCDDIEDHEHVVTPEARQQTQDWFMNELLPALDRDARIRMNATPLDRDSLPMRVKKWEAWQTKVYPIEYVDAAGNRQATWPARYPLEWIDQLKRTYEQAGDLEGFAREYYCVAEDPRARIFTSSMFKIVPRLHTWEPVFAMYDPARTTKSTSATTGWAIWSWIANRLIIWGGGGDMWKPDEMIAHIFDTNERYSPVCIGVEEDGLNEFILQPLRHEQFRRNVVVPIRAMKAPKGKLGFIEGLQPYFNAGEVSFAKDCPTLVQQFLSFPTGRIDGPNALAYAKPLRPGLVVYEDFTELHIADVLPVRHRVPIFLCLNADGRHTTAIAVQIVDGALHVLKDWIREGDPGAAFSDIAGAAAVELGAIRCVAGLAHFGNYDRIGLRGAVSKLPAELRRGGDLEVGRGQIRELLQSQHRGEPRLRISTDARWTLNAFAAGYCREIDKRGQMADEATPGLYRTLIEGLEAFTALMKIGMLSDDKPNVRVTEGGQRYVSALPQKSSSLPVKSEFPASGNVTDLAQLTARRP